MDSQTPAPVAAPVKHGARNTVLLIAVFALVAGAIYFVLNNGSQTFKGSLNFRMSMVCPAGYRQENANTCIVDEVAAVPAVVQCPEGQIMGVDACMPDPAIQAAAEAQAQADAAAQAELDRQNAEARAIADCVAFNKQYDVATQQCVDVQLAPVVDAVDQQANRDFENAVALETAACVALDMQFVALGQPCADVNQNNNQVVDLQAACEAGGKVWNGQNCDGNVNANLDPVVDPVAIAQEVQVAPAAANQPIVNGAGGMVPNREVLDAPADLHSAAVQKNVLQDPVVTPVAVSNELIAAKVPAASKISAAKTKPTAKNKTVSVSIPVEAFMNSDEVAAAANGRTTVNGGVNGREIRGDTGPEMLLYPVLVGLANGAYLLKKKLRK